MADPWRGDHTQQCLSRIFRITTCRRIHKQSEIVIQQAREVKDRGYRKQESGNIYAYCALKMLRRYGLRVGALNSLKIDKKGNFRAISKANEIIGKLDAEIIQQLELYGLDGSEPFRNYKESSFSVWLQMAKKMQFFTSGGLGCRTDSATPPGCPVSRSMRSLENVGLSPATIPRPEGGNGKCLARSKGTIRFYIDIRYRLCYEIPGYPV